MSEETDSEIVGLLTSIKCRSPEFYEALDKVEKDIRGRISAIDYNGHFLFEQEDLLDAIYLGPSSVSSISEESIKVLASGQKLAEPISIRSIGRQCHYCEENQQGSMHWTNL